MWLEITYKPTTLFSLKNSSATSSGAKSLPCPSPYAVKMSLLNAMITNESLDYAEKLFPIVRDMKIRFCLPDKWVINNCFIKIMKLRENKTKKEDEAKEKAKAEFLANNPFTSTVAFREYVYLDDTLKVAIQLQDNAIDLYNDYWELIEKWMYHINYFGKRSCFFQYCESRKISDLPEGYSVLLSDSTAATGIMYSLDDVDKTATLSNMNNYDHSVKDAKRVSQIHLFPFRQTTANKSFTYYQKVQT